MAGPWFHDPLGDDSDGLSWATAYKTLAQVQAAAGNGEIINTVGGEVQTVATDSSQTQLTVIGFNPATYTEDGTLAIFSGASTLNNGPRFRGADLYIRNVEVLNYTATGARLDGSNITVINCGSRGCGGNGIYMPGSYGRILSCFGIGNVTGIAMLSNAHYMGYCNLLNNTSVGASVGRGDIVEKCVFEGNAIGIDTDAYGANIIENVFDANTGTTIKVDGPSVVRNNRILVPTGGTGLLTAADKRVVRSGNGYFGSGTHRTLNGIDIDLGTDVDMASAGTVGGGDLSTDPAGEVVAVSTDIGAVGDLANGDAFVSAGLPPDQASGGCFIQQSNSARLGVRES